MRGGDTIRSTDDVFQADMQSDGNWVLYNDGAYAGWATNACGAYGGTGAYLDFQSFDGNLVLYNSGEYAGFASETESSAVWLAVEVDSDLKMYDTSGDTIWHAQSSLDALNGTCPAAGTYTNQSETCEDGTRIDEEWECQNAATALDLAFAVAGDDWTSGCIFHAGQAWYSPPGGATENPSDGYICAL
jgi:hypothetical protein